MTKTTKSKTAAPKADKATEASTVKPAATKDADAAASKQTKADAAKARAAGLSETDQKALDPENRVPKVRVAIDDATNSQHTDDEIVQAQGAKTLKLVSFSLLIERDPMMKIGKRVFEHEIPILEALHGPDKIEVDENSGREEEVTLSAEQEYERLIRTRGEKGAEALRLIFPNASALAHELGLPVPTRRTFQRNRLQEKQQSAQRGAGV